MNADTSWAENTTKFGCSLNNIRNGRALSAISDAEIMTEYVREGGRLVVLNADNSISVVDNKSSAATIAKATTSTLKRNKLG